MVFTWRLSGRLTDKGYRRVVLSIPFWVLHLMIVSAFVAHVMVILFMDMPQVTGPRGVTF